MIEYLTGIYGTLRLGESASDSKPTSVSQEIEPAEKLLSDCGFAGWLFTAFLVIGVILLGIAQIPKAIAGRME